jgi:xanthine dehydrogenase YagR molybdenum-binding subunit
MIATETTGRVRVDADTKVRGEATYVAEHRIEGLAHAVMALSTIARGRIERIDSSATKRVPGVIAVLTHENAAGLNGEITGRPGLDKKLLLLNGDVIAFDRQPIAVVVAETLEAAQEGASALRVTYASESPIATVDDPRASLFPPKQTAHQEPAEIVRGDALGARADAEVVFAATYVTPVENHNPIEPHAAIAQWNGNKLTVYDSTQGVFESRRKIASVFGLPEENVHVISPFVGGGFGNKGSVWEHQILAAAAARHTGRPVKLALARDQMFATTGHRPQTIQRIAFGATAAGVVQSFEHDIVADTSMYDVFMESSGEYTAIAYAFPNVIIRHRLSRINVGTPTFMRAPGEATGTYALEAAMDELAYVVGVDPIELRLRNYAETDPHKEHPFTTKLLRECYARGAGRFGWEKRTPSPRSMRDGHLLIGYGMAGGAYPALVFDAAASVTMQPGGDVVVRSGTHDMGQGTYTALADIAADELGIDAARVRFELGDTAFPRAMNSGGSTTVASVGSAVALACRDLRGRLGGASPDRDVTAEAKFSMPKEREKTSSYSFAAQFAEVAVDPDFGTVRVRRMFGCFDVGRVVNERLSHSQFIGGMTMGIGMALLEQTQFDPGTARIMNANLADYKIPTNADVGDIDAEALGVRDDEVNPIGTKPVGEIGICGAAAAVANAYYHATGERIRALPITPKRRA